MKYRIGLDHAGKEVLIQFGLNPPDKLCEVCVADKATLFPFNNKCKAYHSNW